MPKIPRTFINHDRVRLLLYHLVDEFDYEERQALYFYCYLDDVSVSEIAEKVELSQLHVLSVLTLYSERLTSKLNFLKKAVPYDANDLLPVSEILVEQSVQYVDDLM